MAIITKLLAAKFGRLERSHPDARPSGSHAAWLSLSVGNRTFRVLAASRLFRRWGIGYRGET
jgi:hypothetical protein